MAVVGGLPTQFGLTKMNMWAMLRSLINNDVGILVFSGTPVNGASGTYATKAGIGTILIDIDTGALYVNRGTKAIPVWASAGGAVTGTGGLGAVGNAKATYSFALDGGAISTITPTSSPTLPANAIILGGTIDVTTQPTSSGAATVAFGLGSGAQAASLKAATAIASLTVGQIAIIPVFTAATYLKVAAATSITITVAAFALTAGRFDVNLVYVQGNAT